MRSFVEHRDRTGVLLGLAAIFGALEVGIAAGVGQPALAALPLAVVAGVLFFVDPRVRTAFVIFGGLVVLQSSSGISVAKLAYVAGLLVCAGYSVNSAQLLNRDTKGLLRSLWQATALALPVLAIGVITGITAHNGISAIARDGLSYALLAYIPFFVADAALTGPRFANGLLVCSGAMATLIFTLDWLARRSFASTPKLGLSSFVLVAVFFAYSFARGQREIRWIVVAGIILVAMLATGTRSSALFLLAPAVIILLPTPERRARLGRIVAAAAVLVVCVSVAVATGFISSESYDRLTGAHGNLSLEYSLGARKGLETAALKLIAQAPVFGNGLGTTFSYINTYSGVYVPNLPTSDTILTTPARFGWLGLAILVLIVVVLAAAPWRRGMRDAAAAAGVGLLPVLAAYAIVASPLEDKGLPLGFMLLLGVSAATLNATGASQPESDFEPRRRATPTQTLPPSRPRSVARV